MLKISGCVGFIDHTPTRAPRHARAPPLCQRWGLAAHVAAAVSRRSRLGRSSGLRIWGISPFTAIVRIFCIIIDYHTRQAFAHALGSSILLGSAYAGDAGECHSLVRAWRRCTGVNPGLLAMVCNGGLFGGHMPLLAYSELKQSSESVIERDCSGDKLRTRGGLPGAERIQFERGLSLSVIAASLGGS